MKKFLASLLAITMAATMSVTALAATELETSPANGKSEGVYSIGVDGKYQAGTAATPIISVDIAWEKMEFTYTGGGSSYSTETHKTTTTEGAWSTSRKLIEVANHSNVPVKAEFSFAKGDGVPSGTVGNFYYDESSPAFSADEQYFILKSGEKPADASNYWQPPFGYIYFGVSGDPIDKDQTLGTITVKISTAITTVSNLTDLQTALNASRSTDAIIQLDADIDAGSTSIEMNTAGAAATLDLNGHKLSYSKYDNGFFLKVGGSDDNVELNVTDSKGGGKMEASGTATTCIWARKYANVTIEGGEIIGSNAGKAIEMEYDANVTVLGGVIRGKQNSDGEGGIGISAYGTGTLSVYGGTIEAEGCAISLYGGTAYIEGGTITSTKAETIRVMNGTAYIKDGKITNSGSDTCAIVLEDGPDEGNINIDISGGEIVGALKKDSGTLSVSGGTFTVDPSDYVNTNAYTVTLSDGKYTVTKK